MKHPRKLPFLLAAAALTASSVSAAVVSVNFGSGVVGQTLAGATETAGAIAVNSANWNNATGASGTLAGLLDSTGANTGASVTWSSPNTWQSSAADVVGNDNGLLTKGYLDDGGIRATVTLSPYFLSNVYIIMGSDLNASPAANVTLGGYKVNGVTYGWNGTATAAGVASWTTAKSWSNANTLTEGDNYIKISNVAGAVTVTNPPSAGARAGIAGVQVENAYAGTILHWDTNGNTAGAGGATPAGTWDSSSSNWSADAAGTSAAGVWNGNNVAAFSAGSDATGAYTITVSGTQQARGLWLKSGSLTFTGGTISLTDERTIVAQSGLQTFASDLTGDGDITLSAGGTSGTKLTGNTTGGVTTIASGSGVVELAGNRSATTGKYIVNGATLALDGEAALGATPGAFVADSITLNGGTLTNLSGYDGAGNYAAINDITLGANRGITLASGGGTFRVGSGAGNTLTINGAITGTGGLTKTNTGILALNGANNYTGATLVSAGTLTSSGSLSGTSGIQVNAGATFTNAGTISSTGTSASSDAGGTYALAVRTGGTLNTSGTATLGTAAFNGTTNISGGTVTVTGQFNVGDGSNQSGIINQTAGTVNLNTTDAAAGTRIGHWSGTGSQYNLSGGTLNVLNATLNNGWDGGATFTVSGGTANLKGLANGASGHGGGADTINLTGGTLNIGSSGITQNGGGAKAINLGAGTLGALAAWSSSTAMSLTDAVIGVTVDTTGGAIGLSGVLSGAGKLNKAGAGTLTLSANNTYTGLTAVNGGRLTLNGSNTTAITVASGATLGGTGSTTGTLTLDAGATLAVGATAFTANGVTLSGAVTVLFEGSLAPGANAVLNYGAGGLTGSIAGFTTTTARATFSNDAANNRIIATATTGTRTWNHTGSTWAVGTGTNFAEGDQLFYAGDTVIFGDTAGETVTLSGTLAPSAISVNNSANTYTFSGSGALAGTGSLTKSGAGTLILANTTANTYSGGTTINGGAIVMGSAGAIGASSGAVTVSAGGSLDYAGFSAGNAVTLAGSGNGTLGALHNSAAATTVTTGAITLSGNATISGAGTTSAFTPASINLAGNTLTVTNARLNTSDSTLTAGDINGGANALFFLGGTQTGAGSTGTWTLGAGSEYAVRDYNNAGLTSRKTLTLDGGKISNGNVDNGGGAQSTIANTIVVNSGGGTIQANNTGFGLDLKFSGAISGNGALALTGGRGVELQGSTSGFTGNITNATRLVMNGAAAQSLSGVISGAGVLIKNGAGTLTLTGSNLYTGATTVSAGKIITGNTTALGTGAVNVTAGTLQIGDGTVNTVTLGSGASLVVASGATLKLGSATSSIALTDAGGFTLGAGATIDLAGLFDGLGSTTTYNLITGGSGTKIAGAQVTGYNTSVFSSVTFDSSGVLTFTAVPEPSTYGLLGAGALAAVALARRRRKAAAGKVVV